MEYAHTRRTVLRRQPEPSLGFGEAGSFAGPDENSTHATEI
jgi:hypothetical protein